jgi:protein SCO1/2
MRPGWRPLLPAVAALLALPLLYLALLQPHAGGGWAEAPPEVRASLWPEPTPLAGFELRDQSGQAFGPERLQGQWSLLFFGYMQCPDVCPTTLSALREMRRLQVQAPQRALPQVVFVSLDPDYDHPEVMAPYLAFFDPDFTGVTGSLEALQPLTTALHIMRVERREGSVRSIDHTSSVIVVDPQGRAIGALSPPHQPSSLLARFEALRDYLGG